MLSELETKQVIHAAVKYLTLAAYKLYQQRFRAALKIQALARGRQGRQRVAQRKQHASVELVRVELDELLCPMQMAAPHVWNADGACAECGRVRFVPPAAPAPLAQQQQPAQAAQPTPAAAEQKVGPCLRICSALPSRVTCSPVY